LIEMRKLIDINCDVGESSGRYQVGNDEALIPHISSCSIACGWHAGDAATIERTVRLAVKHSVRIGAHPSYPDREGFGRRYMQLSAADLSAGIKYQVGVIKALAESNGGKLAYVKPHGALYNRIAIDEVEARTAYEAIREFDDSLSVMGLAGSSCEDVAAQIGIDFISEAFADRTYDDEGLLVSRTNTNALITDPSKAAHQVLDVCSGKLQSVKGNQLTIAADSICIHGDNPQAEAIVLAIRNFLEREQISIGYA